MQKNRQSAVELARQQAEQRRQLHKARAVADNRQKQLQKKQQGSDATVNSNNTTPPKLSSSKTTPSGWQLEVVILYAEILPLLVL